MYLNHDHPSRGSIDHLLGPDTVAIGVAGADGVAVITVVGEVDWTNAARLHDCLHQAIDTGVRQLVVDMEHLSGLDPRGVSVVTEAHQRLSDLGGTLLLLSPSPALQRLFGAAQLVPALSFVGAA